MGRTENSEEEVSKIKMRLSVLRKSGEVWGNLTKPHGRRGVVKYQLSPYELKSYPMFWKSVINTAWRFRMSWYWPVILSYGLYEMKWIHAEADRENRKVDGMFDHES